MISDKAFLYITLIISKGRIVRLIGGSWVFFHDHGTDEGSNYLLGHICTSENAPNSYESFVFAASHLQERAYLGLLCAVLCGLNGECLPQRYGS